MTWHADSKLVIAYTENRLSPAHAASLEAHLMLCGSCRALVAQASDRDRVGRTWAAIETTIDQPRRSIVERMLVRIGVRDHNARLIASTPALQPGWLTAIAAVLVSVLVADTVSSGWAPAFYLFLVAAPLLPLLGVAAAFRPSSDPARELVVAAPKPVLELLLARTVSVLAVTMLLTVLPAATQIDEGWSTLLWLLPAFGLTTATMALATWLPAHWAGAGLSVLWVAAATVNARGVRVSSDAVTNFVAFQPLGQLGFAAIAAIATGVILLRRTSLEVGRIA